MLHPLDIYTFPILVCFPHPSALGNGSVISGMEIEDRDRGSRRRWLNISFQVMTRCRVSPNRSLCPPGARWPVDLHTDSFRFLHFRMRFLLRRRAGLHKSIDLSAACRRGNAPFPTWPTTVKVASNRLKSRCIWFDLIRFVATIDLHLLLVLFAYLKFPIAPPFIGGRKAKWTHSHAPLVEQQPMAGIAIFEKGRL